MTYFNLIKSGEKQLQKTAGKSAYFESEQLMMRASGLSKVRLITKYNLYPDKKTCGKYKRLLARRAAGEPLQLILGTAPFYGRDFYVRKGVLIPRQDTEALIEAVKKLPLNGADAVEAGSGSGIIPVTLCLEAPGVRCVDSYDVNPDAVRLSALNSAALGTSARTRFRKGDFFRAIRTGRKRYNLIVSNPPYVNARDMKKLSPEVLLEPKTALSGGRDGLSFYRRMAAECGRAIVMGGYIAVEIGYGQSGVVKRIFRKKGWEFVVQEKDSAGKIRALVFKFRKVGRYRVAIGR